MPGFFILGGIFTLLIVGGAAFAWRRMGHTAPEAGREPRSREEARRWQARCDDDDDFTSNFHRPTQNELLESLQTLDHLSPLWDQGDETLVAVRLKNELAESFPTLRKSDCAYPQPGGDDLASLPGSAALSPDALDAPAFRQTAARARIRAEFRAARAHANALHQLTSSPETGPVEITAGSLPFHVSSAPVARRRRVMPKLLGASALAACLALAGWYIPSVRHLWSVQMAPSPAVANDDHATPAPVPAAVEPSRASASPAPVDPTPNSQAVAASTDHTAVPTPVPETSSATASTVVPAAAVPQPAAVSPATPAPLSPEMLLAQRVAESKLRAIDKHPSLMVPNSELNVRFVFRYKNLLTEKSPRLRDPQWPEKLADECAQASESESRRKKLTQATAKPQ